MQTVTGYSSSDFYILSSKEENELNAKDRIQYYKRLRQYILKRPLKNTTKGATTIAPKLKGITNHLAKLMCNIFAKDAPCTVDGQENIPEGTVIFAHSHQGILDNFIWIPQVKQHCILLHGAEVNKLLLAAQLNTGLVLVVKGDKENNQNAKLDMLRLLYEGHSITYFPEGTWNLSPNKLHLPLSYGFLDIARKTGTPVIPVVHEYTYDTTTEKERIIKIHSRYGKPIL